MGLKIALLSGAYKNAGDFLIESRAKELLEHLIPDISIKKFLCRDISNNLSEINKMDVAIFTGGPIYMEDLSTHLSFIKDKNIIKPRTMILGGGWYGSGRNGSPYRYHFTQNTRKYIGNIDSKGYGLACRDICTFEALQNEGFKNVILTGCPAWYDLKYIDKTVLASQGEVYKIAVSTPASIFNLPQTIHLLHYLQKKYKGSKIKFVFHRGINSDTETNTKEGACLEKFVNYLKKEDVRIHDISYNSMGFRIYDDCDLHIGYRVHAHIYNLSHRRRTILIEEDGRGIGVNRTLGLPSITAYNNNIQIPNKYINTLYRISGNDKNAHMLKELDSYLKLLYETDYQYLVNAFHLMRKYYENMKKYIYQLGIK